MRMVRIASLLICLNLVALVAAEDLTSAIPADEIAKIRAALPTAPLVKPAKPRRVLIYNDCRGYRHSAVPYGAAALRMIGEKTGAYEAVFSDDPAVFSPERLGDFDAVCFNNTTGELFDDVTLKDSLLNYARRGGGIVGIHAATDCFYQWPEYGELMGAYFDGHPWHADQTVTVKIDEPAHPIVAMFDGKSFKVTDEIYQFRAPYSRDRLRVLMSLDTDQTDMTLPGINRTDGDFAVSWVRNYGRGRVFFCSLGHNHHIFWTPVILKHYLAGVQFACGDLRASAVPSAQLGEDGWIHQFNGKDLTGWLCPPDSWAVKDGILTRKGGDTIWSQQQYEDFILDLEYKLAPNTNSGVFIRCSSIEDWLNTAIEIQVLDSYGKETPGKHDAGAIYDIKAPRVNAVRPPGEWNHLQVTARGSRLQVELNGIDVIDIDLDDWTEAGQNPDGTPNKFKFAYKDLPRRGHIGLQDHGDPVWYRNVRIKPLESAADQ